MRRPPICHGRGLDTGSLTLAGLDHLASGCSHQVVDLAGRDHFALGKVVEPAERRRSDAVSRPGDPTDHPNPQEETS